ncbi:MAG TPA: molybdopterin-synthase adenylyltransferase MoeB [Fimbriimonas sp.]|nr:molybdopterin-synthase adenylyltransferase MoeB [Fimbriimonas sp.]
MLPDLSREELIRYSRHLILPEVGPEGQKRLKAAKVLLVGAGGLGSPTALYLAAAGVGQLGIVDFDSVDLTNLHRQIIHGTNDVGRPKLDSAEEKIQAVNPHVQVVKHQAALTSENALDVIQGYDLVVDGTDNFPTRYLVNDACILLGKVNMYGSIFRFDGQATVFCAPNGPCYRCLFPEPPPPGVVPSCAEGGVLGVLPGIIGLIQATEAVKWILNVGEPLVGRLMLYDALGMRFTEVKIKRDPSCPVCGDNPTIKELIDYDQFCGVTHREKLEFDLEPAEFMALTHMDEPFTLIDVREPYEYAIARIPGARLIPLGDLPNHLQELDKSQKTVLHCQSGVRSVKAARLLQEAGFQTVLNLQGGIDAWMKIGGQVEE